MSSEYERQQSWLQDIMRKHGLKPTTLAKSVGLAPSTVLRALDPAGGSVLDTRSIAKIVDKFGGDGPRPQSRAAQPAGGFAEPDAEMLPLEAGATFAGAPLSPTQGVWQQGSRLLEAAGCLPGDELLADSAVAPRAGDLVVAQDLRGPDRAVTLVRLYDPPYLLTEPADRTQRQKPLLVDNVHVSIWGTVVAIVRRRKP
jgi:hypothetical protein